MKEIKILLSTLSILFLITEIKAQVPCLYSTGIIVQDIDSSASWYKNILILETKSELIYPNFDSLKIVILGNEYYEIELIENTNSFGIKRFIPDYNINNEPMLGIFKFGFEVENLKQTFDEFKAKNISFAYEITEDPVFCRNYFMIIDPDGNILQFFESVN
ncbi:MAG: VOC family protein [Flavobacteriales bacterium]|nr:VOC family protein [Flavobacteriales bacterium]